MLIYFLQDFYDEIADQIFKLREQREKCTVNTAARDAQIARMASPKYQIHRWNISYPAGISYLSDTWRTRCNSLRRRGGTPDFSSIVLCVCNFFNISYRKSFL